MFLFFFIRFIICFIIIWINFSCILNLYCCPLEVFMNKNEINDRTYFYYDDIKIEIQKQIIEYELTSLVNNFDSVTFDLVKFLKNNNNYFPYKHPNNHPNILLKILTQPFQYYYSFPFTQTINFTNFDYYESFSKNNFFGLKINQYWRPYFSINNNRLVNVKPFNVMIDDFVSENYVYFKIYNILKSQLKK